MDIYQSARLITSSGNLKKNKGIMLFADAAGKTCELKFRGLSGGQWVDSIATFTQPNGANGVIIIPVATYGVTLGTFQATFELN